MNFVRMSLVLGGMLALGACQTTEEFEVTAKSVAPGSDITWVGKATRLVGAGGLRVGEKLPDVVLTNLKMQESTLTAGKTVKVIDTIPSIDTEVCDRQTHILGETNVLNPVIERITVSLDLPYAQGRFADEAKLNNVAFLSDYRAQAFAKASGLQIERNGLLARAVIVVDQQGIVRHLQIVPEILQLPDMEKAFAVANELANAAAH